MNFNFWPKMYGGGSGGSGGSGGGGGASGSGAQSSSDGRSDSGGSRGEQSALETPTSGSIRFNTDSSKLEMYNGEAWWNIDSTSPTEQTGGTRGIWAGGRSHNVIDHADLDSTGNAADFGDLSASHFEGFATASRTRFITGGTLSYVNTVEFVTIASRGDGTDFGDQSVGRRNCAGSSNGTRGVVSGGIVPGSPYQFTNVIDYVEIAQTGNFIDFGDLSTTLGGGTNQCNSQTRAVHIGGSSGAQPSVSANNTMEYITISTTGNAAEFGDQQAESANRGSASNSIRAVIGESGAATFITIATLGNTQDFADSIGDRAYQTACASPTRVVWGGGETSPPVNTMDYVQIMSAGNAIDFGDLSDARFNAFASSNGHGGLG